MYRYHCAKYPSLRVRVSEELVIQFDKGNFETEDKAVAKKLEKVSGVTRHADSPSPKKLKQTEDKNDEDKNNEGKNNEDSNNEDKNNEDSNNEDKKKKKKDAPKE